ncbi:KRR1 interacting protein [Trema orientale]|uniref:KRR1 interacting protein n=1 Tax=Trema orientale TaxID=63057 RepID=A0A2P5EUB5_TREOI|nr:KRR1 interacting protein [Trema orientale]
MGTKLFNDSDSDNDNLAKIEVDKEFARRYEHNKKREDLQRYEELKKKGLIPRLEEDGDEGEDEDSSEESSLSDDDISVDLKKKDLEFFDALIKVRKQDPSLKNKDVKLFESESESDDNLEGEDREERGNEVSNMQTNEKKKKAMYLKDVVAKHLMEEGPEFSDKDERNNKKKLAYNEEQEEIRKAFLEAVEGNGVEEDEGDLLTVKEKTKVDQDESDNEEFQNKLDEYFGGVRGEKLDNNAKFLKEYFMNKMWIDRDNNDADEAVGFGEELEMLSEDEKEIEKQEEYEYRFQENPGDRVLGHSREVEGSVRKKVKARKEQRKHKEERMEIARLEREEELRHLKNLKKKEMDDRVKKIMESAGIREDEVVHLSAKELEDEFDPEEYDRMMKKTFGNKYYEAEDADPEFGSNTDEDVGEIEKPDFDKEDELLGFPKGWDRCETDDGFLAARDRALKQKTEIDSEHEEEAEEVTEEGKRKRKRKSAILEKAKQAMLEEYYKLDYEDTIGDLKTRFKYAKIKPNRFGLTAAEILMTDDKKLNEYVSLKQIAPYKDKEWKVPNSKRYQFKSLTKELRGGKPTEQKHGKKKRMRNDANIPTSSEVALEDNLQLEQSTGDMSNLSRQARRRKRQAQFKLAHTRSGAYQMKDPKPKKKVETEN